MKESDLRVIKTKKALSSSLYGLLEQHLFESITVNQLCANATVHRTTFYKHFYDKYDLLVYLFRQLTKDYFAIDIKERVNHPFQTLDAAFSDKKELQKIVDLQEEDGSFTSVLKDVYVDIMKNDIKDNLHRIDTDPAIPADLIFYIYGSAVDGFMEWIRKENIDWPPEKIDEVFQKAVNLKIKD